MAFCGFFEALVLCVKRGVGGFGAADLVLGLRDLFPALLNLEDRLLQLGFQLGDFEHGQSLALVDDVADVDVDLFHVAADLGVNVNDLVWLELPSQREHVRDIASLRGGNARGWNRGRPGVCAVGVGLAAGYGKRSEERGEDSQRDGCGSLILRVHKGIAPGSCSVSESRLTGEETRLGNQMGLARLLVVGSWPVRGVEGAYLPALPSRSVRLRISLQEGQPGHCQRVPGATRRNGDKS